MIRIDEVRLSPQKVYQSESFTIQVKVSKDEKALNKLPFKLSSKLGGGIKNGGATKSKN
ncbi:MAG TPA: hypothetical protein IAB45_03590 [Candidatus Onthousia faecavium]|nr:hypothetical protein [Candidatus Onthousia faecavium]